MRTNKTALVATVAIASFIFFGTAYAEDKAATATPQSHEEHHPDAQAPEKDTGKMPMGDQGGMMGKMDMSQMQGMMHECMEMHKDGKMCDHDMMSKCQEKMGKGECSKMMKQAKAQNKNTKKK